LKSAEIAGTMGADAIDAVPLLIQMVAEPERFGLFGISFEEKRTALDALRSIGAPAIPAVIDASTAREARIRKAAVEILGSLDAFGANSIQVFVKALRDKQADVRHSAIEALAKGGRENELVARELFSVLRADREVRDGAARSLGDLGSVGELYLRQAVHDQDPDIRRAATLGLVSLGKTGVLLLNDAVHDNDRGVIKSALLELTRAKHQAAPSIDALVAILEGNDAELQDEAMRVIVEMGDAAQPAVPHLTRILSSSDPKIRSSACWALGRIGPVAKTAMPALARLLGTESYARWALLKIDVDSGLVYLIDSLNEASDNEQNSIAYDLSEYSTQAAPLLLSALRRHNTNGRLGVVKALATVKDPDDSTISALVSVFERDESTVRVEAIQALVRFGSDSDLITSTLSRAFNDPDPAVRFALLDSIRSDNYKGTPSPNALIERLADPDIKVREAAARALTDAGHASISSLIRGLDDQRQSVREYSVLALGHLGRRESSDELRASVPYLVLALRYHDPGLFRFAIWTHGPTEYYGRISDSLRTVGPATKNEVPALANALTYNVEEVREAAAIELGRIGRDAVAAVPALLSALEDKDPRVREAAIVALGKVGSEAHSALPPLTAILSIGRSTSDDDVVEISNKRDVASLVQSFRRADRSGRAKLAVLLGQVGAQSGASALLIESLNDYDPDVREAASTALEKMGSAAIPALIEGLKSPNAKIRAACCLVLSKLGPAAKPAVDALVVAATDASPDVGAAAIDALGLIGPVGKPAIPTLALALKNGEFSIRFSAKYALARIGKPAMPTLIQLLKSKNDDEVEVAIEVLQEMKVNVEEATQPLMALLDSKNDRVAVKAANALGVIGKPARKATPKLIALLSRDYETALQARNALKGIGQPAVPDLIRALSNENPQVRSEAASVLGLIGKDARPATEPLMRMATADVESARFNAVQSLGKIGPVAQPAVPLLIGLLESADDSSTTTIVRTLGAIDVGVGPVMSAWLESGEEEKRRRATAVLAASDSGLSRLIQALASNDEAISGAAVEGLASAGARAIPSLLRASVDENHVVRALALRALSKIEPKPEETLPFVIRALNDPHIQVRNEAMDALVRFKDKAVPSVSELLVSPDVELRKAGCLVLGNIGQPAVSAIPLLRDRAGDSDLDVRAIAAYAVLAIERETKSNVDLLTMRLEKSWYETSMFTGVDRRNEVTNTIANIAESLVDAQDVSALPELRNALKLIGANDPAHARVSRAIVSLEAIESSRRERVLSKFWNTPWFPPLFLFASAYLFWILVIRFLILIQWPLSIWKWNSALKPVAEVKLPTWSAGVPIPLKYILGIGFFEYHDRVLDAWIRSRQAVAQENFLKLPTVKSRAVHVEVPVVLNGTTLIDIKAEHLKPLFGSTKRSCLLIVGEGGAGKTSFACLLGRRALGYGPLLIADHPMLPILLEEELDDPDHAAGSRRLFEAIRGRLTTLIGDLDPVDSEFTRRLLKRKRLLVIVDHLSELSQETRTQFRPASPDFPIGAFVVTSRVENVIDGIPKSVIKPQRIAGNRLTSFMEAYLTQVGKRELFDDQEYIEACLNLTRIVEGRDVTLLLGKMFADQLIVKKEENDLNDLPLNIPDLMLKYVHYLHHRDDDHDAIRQALADSKIVAWMCVREHFYPTRADRTSVLYELGAVDCPERLEHLENGLHLLATDGLELNRVRFLLDPLAEYLAALHVIELYSSDELRWNALLQRLSPLAEASSVPQGFMLALRDCCRYKVGEYAIPDFVQVQLTAMLH
jgi:HEAT repeat protein